MDKVYIDENGDNGLDFNKLGTKNQFILTAIIVNEEKENSVIQSIEGISKKYLKGAEIKSKRIRDPEKRKLVLKKVLNLDIKVLSLIVDKRDLEKISPGYTFKKTFYKNIPNKLYTYLKALLDKAEIIPDPVGSTQFQEELKRYVVESNPPDLFSDSCFYFGSAKDNRITQLADLISGSIAKKFSNDPQYFDIIRDKIVLKQWPQNTNRLPAEIRDEVTEYDEDIAESGFSLAKLFLEQKSDSDDRKVIDQCRLLEILIFELVNGNPRRYIPSFVLRKNLARSKGVAEIGEYYFRTKIVGKLRSSDVMIVSNRKGGYKIPISLNDINDYLLNLNEKVQPMLERVEKLRGHVHLKTGHDILEREEYRYLRIKNDLDNSN